MTYSDEQRINNYAMQLDSIHGEINKHGIEKDAPEFSAPGRVRNLLVQHDRLRAALSAETRRAERAEAEVAEARHELSQCDDIKLDQSLAGAINELQRRREFAESEMREWTKAMDEAARIDQAERERAFDKLAKEYAELEKYEADQKANSIREQLEGWNV